MDGYLPGFLSGMHPMGTVGWDELWFLGCCLARGILVVVEAIHNGNNDSLWNTKASPKGSCCGTLSRGERRMALHREHELDVKRAVSL